MGLLGRPPNRPGTVKRAFMCLYGTGTSFLYWRAKKIFSTDQPRYPDALLDDEAFEAELMRLRPALMYYVRTRGGGDATEDIVQEALLKAWIGRGQFDQTRAPLSGWLRVIALNIAKDYWQRAIKLPSSSLGSEVETLPDPGYSSPSNPYSETEQKEKDQFVWRSIQSLPRQQREVVGRFMEGSTFQEIAMNLNITTSTVYNLFHQAKGKLRKQFVERFGGELHS